MSTSPNQGALELFAKAQAYHRSGQLGLAESHYLRVTKLDARNGDAWHLLGVVAYQQGKVDLAITRYRRAVDLRPRAAEMLNNLALALRARGDLAAAADCFARALQVRPEYPAAAYNLALLREQAGDAAAAENAYHLALTFEPDALNSLTNLGNLLRRQGRYEEAEKYLVRAQRGAGGDAGANGNLAQLRIDQGRHAEACALAEAATRIEPDGAHWWETLGTAQRLAQDADGAANSLQRAAALAPADSAIQLQLALALQETADHAGARAAFDRARKLAPNWVRARWEDALSVPSLPDDAAAIQVALAHFDEGLADLQRNPGDAEAAYEAAQSVGVFGLHYLPGDHTARQRRLGDLLATVAARARPQFMAPPEWKALSHGGRLRVGFISSYLREHVVERFFGGWIFGLDTSRFERFVWFTGMPDARTAALREAVEHFSEHSGSLDALAEQVRAARLDVLVYPDVGLDPRQQMLATLRLAPVQCAAYGHPVGTGSANVDYFLSGDALEPAQADTQYREQLVRLPHLGCVPRAPAAAAHDEQVALRVPGRPLLLCLQNLIKMQPAFDRVLAQVLARTGARLVLFDRSEGTSRRFRQRIDPSLRGVGLDPAEVLLIEGLLPYERFLVLVRQADLILDTPGFSGGGTSLDALGMGTPVLTFEGEFARGRQTTAMLQRLELPRLIAHDDADYIDKAVTLCTDADVRETLRTQIRARNDRLFDDPEVLPALESFLLRAACATSEQGA
jgi:predicted O-linked N-acetylglucosamine transferase (SPINDLY family)